MKCTIKRILSIVLALILFMTSLPGTVNAAESYTRLYGETRYETAIAAADALKEELGIDRFNSIVVADGLNFADALSGSYLAAVKNAPILLVADNKIDDIQAYISENLISSGRIYILGGTNAVSADVENSLASFDVVRLAGATRYETNLKILEEAGVDSQEILICTGNSFADSLSASAVGKPILLVGSALTEGQKAFLESSSGEFIIIGGTNTVSETVENQLSEYGGAERLSGETRYETSVMVAERFFTKPGAAVLAYAKNFPDGLCGGPLAYAMGAPMILTATGSEPAADAYAAENGITSGIVLGGNGLISDGSCQKIFDGNEHSHSYTKEVTAPTCEMEGYTTYTCSCGDSYKGDETAALGHKWGEWVRTKEPTTEAEGEDTRTCTRSGCGKTETRAVEKLPAETEPDDNTVDISGSHYSVEAAQLINEHRVSKQLPELNIVTAEIALIRAAELTIDFSHTRPYGGTIYDYGWYSECVTGGTSASDAVNKWIASSSHEPTLARDAWTDIVVAYNGVCWVVLFR